MLAAVEDKSLMPAPDSPLSERVLDTLASLLPPNYQADPTPLEPKCFPELEPLPVSYEDTPETFSSCQVQFMANDVNNPSLESFFQSPQQGNDDDQGLDFYFPNIKHATSA
jgi:hypothetical protein